MSAHELNEICAFPPITTFKVATLFLSTQISAETTAWEDMSIFISSMIAANRMSWNVD